MALLQLFVFLGSFVMIWYGAGKVISAADKFAHRLRVSTFAFSFLVLGLFTSLPEFGVGLTAVAENNPEIFVGNLIGGIPVLFLLIIPLLAIFGRGLKLNNSISRKNLIASFAVVLAPSFFVIDSYVSVYEAIAMIVLYFLLFFLIQRDKGILENGNNNILNSKSYSMKDILSIIFGIGLVFVASHYIVEGTIFFGSYLGISTFFISLILISIGTNLPELTLAIKAVLSGKKDVAFGDYVGSGALNTLLFGLLVIISGGAVHTRESFLLPFLMLTAGLVVFYFFAFSKNVLTRKEGLVLVALFVIFGAIQLL